MDLHPYDITRHNTTRHDITVILKKNLIYDEYPFGTGQVS
jgi:hypothetical protein